MKKASLLFLLVILTFFADAQKVENVDFKMNDSKMIITYDLINCADRTTYDMTVKLITESGKTIYPKNAVGDITGISEGTGKKITWDVLNDGQELKENISVIVEIAKWHYNKTKHERLVYGRIKGGPSNAFLSMLLPGLGDVFVNKYSANKGNKKKNFWWLVPVAYYCCLYGALSQYSSYQTNYSSYHSAINQIDMDNYFSTANTNYQNCQLYLGLAASMWACDVIHVAVKGFRNRHGQLKGFSMIESKTNIYLAPANRSYQLGLVYKF